MAKKTLKISKEISLPADAVTQTIGVIGRKGAGKTYLASVIVEHILDIKAQVVVVDPVGVWWGLRVNADGKTKGKEIFVIGGEHGDVPLVPEAGRRIAQLIVEKGVSAVLDVSSFGIGERKRFCADFGEEFFQLKKKKRSPVMLALEEAQLVVPQNIRPEEGRMYSAFEQIVRLGRNYGIGTMLITQRPQSVNKEVLSQVECLCVLQITGPHERKAIEAWVEEAGADRKLVGELPGLQRGEGYVWSPQWLRIYERVHFSTKQTFDASATPEVGKKTKAASLSAVDVGLLKQEMADVVEQAEKDDPVKLHKRIKELETLANKPAALPVAMGVSQWYEYGKKNAYTDFFENKIKAERDTYWGREIKEISKSLDGILGNARSIVTTSERILDKMKAEPAAKPIVITPQPNHFSQPKEMVATPVIVSREGIEGDVSTPERRVLDAIAFMASIGVKQPAKEPVAFLAGYTPSSGSFKNAAGQLRSKGLVEYPGGNIELTSDGWKITIAPDRLTDHAELHERIMQKLPSPERKLLELLIQSPDTAISDQELALAAGYTPTSGSFKNARGRLRTFGLVTYPRPGHTQAAPLLFP